jgi:hypothetical protein
MMLQELGKGVSGAGGVNGGCGQEKAAPASIGAAASDWTRGCVLDGEVSCTDGAAPQGALLRCLPSQTCSGLTRGGSQQRPAWT